MEMTLLLVGGLALLIAGSELLVRGAVGVAERLGVSPLLIGLTLVGFGTSTPELVTSVQAALVGSPGIAFGNIVGSNIANILLIVGLAAVIAPMEFSPRALRRDGYCVVGAAAALVLASQTVGLSRAVGFLFVPLLVAYVVFAYRSERSSSLAGHTAVYDKAAALAAVDAAVQPVRAGARGVTASLVTAVLGLAMVIAGGWAFVDGAVLLARTAGMSEETIGLTIIAVGTSTPELFTSTVAAVRGRSDVAIGNILGSNIYNVLGIGGLTALIAPTAIPADIADIDGPVMVAVSIALVAFAWHGRIERVAGAALLAGYAGYLALLFAR